MKSLTRDLADNVLMSWFNFEEGFLSAPPKQICEAGGGLLTERIRALSAFCASAIEGDLVEIGAWAGATTRVLCEAAKRFNRRVLVVDPWQDNDQYSMFMRNTAEYADVLDVLKFKSQSDEAVEEIKRRSLCFAYVDGEHTYEAVAKDIHSLSHCHGLIACDDVSWNDGIKHAVIECEHKLQMRHPGFREAYLISL